MHRIRELFKYFITASKSSYQPHESIALDEAMKKFKGRCVFKQYIKNKPVRWGLKIYCVACSKTAYLCNAEFYLGKSLDDVAPDTSILQQILWNQKMPILRAMNPIKEPLIHPRQSKKKK
jgi:hypothetical protein